MDATKQLDALIERLAADHGRQARDLTLADEDGGGGDA